MAYKKIQDEDGNWAFAPFGDHFGMLFWGITEYVILERASGRTAKATPASLKKIVPADKLKRMVSQVELNGEYKDALFHVRISKQDNAH